MNVINEIVRETINKYLKENLIKEIEVTKFTPYSNQEAEMNRMAALGQGENNRSLAERNPSYGAFKAWRDEQIANGVPSIEASFENYRNMIKNSRF